MILVLETQLVQVLPWQNTVVGRVFISIKYLPALLVQRVAFEIMYCTYNSSPKLTFGSCSPGVSPVHFIYLTFNSHRTALEKNSEYSSRRIPTNTTVADASMPIVTMHVLPFQRTASPSPLWQWKWRHGMYHALRPTLQENYKMMPIDLGSVCVDAAPKLFWTVQIHPKQRNNPIARTQTSDAGHHATRGVSGGGVALSS